MEQKTSNELKQYFQTGFKPTEQHFADLIDSSVNQVDAAITVDKENKYLGIGPITSSIGDSPRERLQVAGGVMLGMTDNNNAGTLRWNQDTGEFQGNYGTHGGWKSLAEGQSPSTAVPGKGVLTVDKEGHVEISTGSASPSGGTASTPLMTFSSGNVGIANQNPAQRLDVGGNIRYSGDLFAASDQRIKNIQGRSDEHEDLKTLLKVEITDYTFKDHCKLGNGAQKKVIGQQVDEVFPQAVKKHTDVLPDISQTASMEQGWVSLAGHGLKSGEWVRLDLKQDTEKKSQIYTVNEVSAEGFRVDADYSGTVFVYGREVDDFHTVDYQALAMLHISATQALYQQVQEQAQKIKQLKATLNYK